jgi:succinyl-CoA synthetase beta subunit
MLNLSESFKLLKGVNIAEYKLIKSEKELDFGFPYYMKLDIAEHKTELNGVRLCRNLEEAGRNYKEMKKLGKIIVQKPVEGKEMILGIKQDEVFGRLLLIGFGGIDAEILKDISFRALPVDRDEIKKMLESLKLYPTLVSRKKYAVENFIELVEKIAKLAEKHKIKEMDLNPVIINERDAYIVDARVSL